MSFSSDVKKELVGLLNLLDEACLIHIVAVILPEGLEIHHPVGNSFAVFAGLFVNHSLTFLYVLQK